MAEKAYYLEMWCYLPRVASRKLEVAAPGGAKRGLPCTAAQGVQWSVFTNLRAHT